MLARIKFHGSYKDLSEPAVLSLDEIEVAVNLIKAVEDTVTGSRNHGYSGVVNALCVEFRNEPTQIGEILTFLKRSLRDADSFFLCRQVNGAWRKNGVLLTLVPEHHVHRKESEKRIQIWRRIDRSAKVT